MDQISQSTAKVWATHHSNVAKQIQIHTNSKRQRQSGLDGITDPHRLELAHQALLDAKSASIKQEAALLVLEQEQFVFEACEQGG